MNTMIKNTIFSVATCALLLSMQGCGSDRAGISTQEADTISSSSINGTDSTIEEDRDHDWIPDDEEAKYGTDPDNADSDGDGITDGCEMGLDPRCKDTAYQTNQPMEEDSDNDGLCDGDEVGNMSARGNSQGLANECSTDLSSYITEPLNADTDGDGLSDKDEVLTHNTDPLNLDTDGDSLCDGDEVGNMRVVNNSDGLKGICSEGDKSPYDTNPKVKDTDGDMLSDGFEVLKSNTYPQIGKEDSDNDGVTDGIEVCGTTDFGTTRANDGKIESTNNSITINENDASNFYNDILGGSIVVVGNTSCSHFADAMKNDNDSDGDGRPNIKEKDHGTDPLHAGANPDTTDFDVAKSDLDNKYYYPWITQTPDGDKMVKAGFVYVPKVDSKGFWISQYEAVYTDSNEDSVKFVEGGTKVNNINKDDAKQLVEDSKDSLGIDNNITLPTQQQYKDVVAVKISGSDNDITIKNSVNDENMPKSYEVTIGEFKSSSDNGKNQEFYTSGTVYINKDATLSDDDFDTATDASISTKLRASTTYIQ